MALQVKYDQLIRAAENAGVSDLKVREHGNVLYIDGNVPSEQVKKQLWDEYGKIDPDFRAGDLIMNLQVSGAGAPVEYEVVRGDSLSKIGERYNVNWRDIYEANRDKIKDPDLIQPGWKLKIPGANS